MRCPFFQSHSLYYYFHKCGHSEARREFVYYDITSLYLRVGKSILLNPEHSRFNNLRRPESKSDFYIQYGDFRVFCSEEQELPSDHDSYPHDFFIRVPYELRDCPFNGTFSLVSPSMSVDKYIENFLPTFSPLKIKL